MIFILVDSYLKWFEVVPMTTATSSTTIDCLRSILATYRIHDVFMSDNDTKFTSAEFKKFVGKKFIPLGSIPRCSWELGSYSMSSGSTTLEGSLLSKLLGVIGMA